MTCMSVDLPLRWWWWWWSGVRAKVSAGVLVPSREGGGGGVLDIEHGRSRVIIDSRISFHCQNGARRVFTDQADIACLHQARSAVRRSASCMTGDLHRSC